MVLAPGTAKGAVEFTTVVVVVVVVGAAGGGAETTWESGPEAQPARRPRDARTGASAIARTEANGDRKTGMVNFMTHKLPQSRTPRSGVF